MANFKRAFDITMGNEGGYSNDPDDAGGETYRGIARRYHPGWPGWIRIDASKGPDLKPRNVKEFAVNMELDRDVQAFYKAEFWDRMHGDSFPDQDVVEEVFDTGVNMGLGRAALFLQKALNFLNRAGQAYPDISEDGAMGSGTLRVLSAHLTAERGDSSTLLKAMNILQGAHYLEYMKKDPSQEKFARGWLKRITINKA